MAPAADMLPGLDRGSQMLAVGQACDWRSGAVRIHQQFDRWQRQLARRLIVAALAVIVATIFTRLGCRVIVVVAAVVVRGLFDCKRPIRSEQANRGTDRQRIVEHCDRAK